MSFVMLVLAVPALSYAQGVPGVEANKCLAGKNKCVSKKVKGLLKCRERCQRSPSRCGQEQADCETKVMEKFDGGPVPAKGCFARLEANVNLAKPSSICTTTDDTAAVEAQVDAAVADLVEALEGSPQPVCGNSVLEGDEECEFGQLNGQTCVTLGLFGANLACTPGACVFDTSGCSAQRFEDTGVTVLDHLTGLEWEKKVEGSGCLHCVEDRYPWSPGFELVGPPTESPSMFDWVSDVNGFSEDGEAPIGLGGHGDWRIPSVAELQTIQLEPEETHPGQPCSVTPCIDPIFGPTMAADYWSSTPINQIGTSEAFIGDFVFAGYGGDDKAGFNYVRAVRGGL